ncbi:MAG: AtpZ/AtpI family protein [Actinomycetota bacterium]
MQPIPTHVSLPGRAARSDGSADADKLGVPSNQPHDRGRRAALSNRGGFKGSPMLGRGLALGFEFAAAVALFWWLGRLVDGWLGIEPWAQIGGSIIGWVGGTIHVVVGAQRIQEPKSRPRSKDDR